MKMQLTRSMTNKKIAGVAGGRAALAMLISLLLVPLLSACNPREPLSDVEVRQQLEAYIETRARDDHFSGTVLLAKDGVPIFAKGFGMANKAAGTRNDVETIYAVASVTKLFTSIAIGQLIEQGKLGLNDSISMYLTDYPAEIGRNVTIANLLTHSSGIPDFFTADSEQYKAVKNSRNPHRDFISVFADKPLNFEPGARYEYSNSNYLLLGAIIEHVSGQTYYNYVREHIFEPAGIQETFWFDADVPAERLALRYTSLGSDGRPKKGERTVVDSGYITTSAMGGAYGGGYTTAGDLLKLLRALRQHTLLSEQTTRLLFTDQIDTDEKGARQAYGFVVHLANGKRAVGHGGDAEGIANHAFMYPGGFDLILLSNYDNSIYSMRRTLNDGLMR